MYEVRKLRKLGESQWVKIIAFGDVNSMVKKTWEITMGQIFSFCIGILNSML